MASAPNTRCGTCGRPIDERGYCPVCTSQQTQQFTPPLVAEARSPTPPSLGDRGHGMGNVAGPELTGKVCPYCRFPLKEGAGIETCTACGAIHHAECWQDNAGCSVTGCVNGPSNTTATHVVPPAAAGAGAVAAGTMGATAMAAGGAPPTTQYAAPPGPPPPGQQKPPPPQGPQRRFPTAALVAGAVVVALLGAGAAVAISSSSKKSSPSTITVKERTVEKAAAAQSTPTVTRTTQAPTHTSAPAPAPTPTSSGPSDAEREGHAVEAVDSYWGDIENHDFTGAYSIEEPSAGSSESEWVRGEEEEGVENVSYSFEPGGLEGNEATVDVGSLRTEARKTGCYTWTGYYRLTDYSGTWKITHDGLERHSC